MEMLLQTGDNGGGGGARTLPEESTLPANVVYSEGFENNDGGWTTSGTNPSWQWGTPAGSVITGAANGRKCLGDQPRRVIIIITNSPISNHQSFDFSSCTC